MAGCSSQSPCSSSSRRHLLRYIGTAGFATAVIAAVLYCGYTAAESIHQNYYSPTEEEQGLRGLLHRGLKVLRDVSAALTGRAWDPSQEGGSSSSSHSSNSGNDFLRYIFPTAKSTTSNYSPTAEGTRRTSLLSTFVGAFTVIICSELGDKTFLITALLAMKAYWNRWSVFAGAAAALWLMTGLSVLGGVLLPGLLSKELTHAAVILLLAVFGVKMLYESFTAAPADTEEEMEKLEVELSSATAAGTCCAQSLLSPSPSPLQPLPPHIAANTTTTCPSSASTLDMKNSQKRSSSSRRRLPSAAAATATPATTASTATAVAGVAAPNNNNNAAADGCEGLFAADPSFFPKKNGYININPSSLLPSAAAGAAPSTTTSTTTSASAASPRAKTYLSLHYNASSSSSAATSNGSSSSSTTTASNIKQQTVPRRTSPRVAARMAGCMSCCYDSCGEVFQRIEYVASVLTTTTTTTAPAAAANQQQQQRQQQEGGRGGGRGGGGSLKHVCDDGKGQQQQQQEEQQQQEHEELCCSSSYGADSYSSSSRVFLLNSSLRSSIKKYQLAMQQLLLRFVHPLLLQSFLLTFMAEWGDRSQVSTIALAADRNVFAVFAGAVAGHTLCSALAVAGGKVVASRISEKTILLIGGVMFLLFAALGAVYDV